MWKQLLAPLTGQPKIALEYKSIITAKYNQLLRCESRNQTVR